MKIKQNINGFTKEISYHIILEIKDNLIPEEIATCFTYQYPNTKAVLTFTKIRQLEIGMYLLGLNLKGCKIEGKK